MCNINLGLFAIADSKTFAILGNDQEPFHSCSDFRTGEQNPSLSTGQLSLLYKRDDNALSIQSIGRKISKELTLPQEKTVFFRVAGMVSLQLRGFSAVLLQSAGRMAQPQELQGCSQVTRLLSLLHCFSCHCPLGSSWLPSPEAVTASWLHPKDPVVG